MKKISSYYQNYYYSYSYDYQTKQVVLRTRYSTPQSTQFKNYFGKKYVRFDNIKEFKVSINNFSQYINEEIEFKHYRTHYKERYYTINKIYNDKWSINLNIKIDEDKKINFKYGTIGCFHDSILILFNTTGEDKLYNDSKKIIF